MSNFAFQAYHLLDELIIAGELQESSKKTILRVAAAQDAMMEESQDPSNRGGAVTF